GVVDLDVEVAVALEGPGVEQLDLPVAAAGLPVPPKQLLVRVRSLRILVEHPHEGVRRRAVQVPVQLLAVFPVVALLAGEAEEALLEDGIGAVPEGEREAKCLTPVGDAGDAVLVPPVGTGACVVVRQIVPGGPPRAVVLAHGAPGALAEVRAPALPV